MPLPNTTINVTGEIVRPALNKDGVTGLVFYNDNIADLTVFTTTNRIVKFTNLPAIEATGILSTSTNFKEEHYQISEYFRAGGGEVYIGVFAVPVGAYDYTELNQMNLISSGSIKIYGIYNPQAELDVADIAIIQTLVAAYEPKKKPAIAILSQDTSTLTLGGLADLRNLAADASNVSVVIGHDTTGVAATLATAASHSVCNLGIVLGTLANASVEENILNIGKYKDKYTNGVSMVVPGFFINNGSTDNTIVAITSIDDADIDILNDYGYIFWRYSPNYPGTHLSNDNNATKITDTFNSIHIMRVRNKVIRELDGALVPLVGSKLLFNTDGTLRPISIAGFENRAKSVLQSMMSRTEISGFVVYIDPTQEALTTKTVTVQVSIVPVESSDYITINIAFVQSL